MLGRILYLIEAIYTKTNIKIIGRIEMLDRNGRDEMFHRIAHINDDERFFFKKAETLELMKEIVNPNFQDKDGNSYLHMACQSHSLEAIKILLDLGADPNIEDKRGFSPITSALGRLNKKNAEVLELMLQNGLDLDHIERDMSLRDWIKQFKEDELNAIVERYDHK